MEWKPVLQGTYGSNTNAFSWVAVEIWNFEKLEHKTLTQWMWTPTTWVTTIALLVLHTGELKMYFFSFFPENVEEKIRIHKHFFLPFCMVKLHCSNFRITTVIFSGVWIMIPESWLGLFGSSYMTLQVFLHQISIPKLRCTTFQRASEQ